ncbi:aldolase [Biomaibacter acetigenes]|uniref:Aldolase n=1 Tax=Biomaibacter acetigenes TaxID=2316383 RepID=A0A3G2R727_9FIRM|nr:aldolase [Biomaibacter acetigenes]
MQAKNLPACLFNLLVKRWSKPLVTRIFEFVIIDTEHGPFGPETDVKLVRAADAADMVSVIRVPENTEIAVTKALDTGTSGIVVPGISNVQDARKAVKYAKYAPIGSRGACPCVRANRYGVGDSTYYRRANEDTSVILLIEGKEGLQSFEEILNVEYVDAILLGPVDLSHSLGVPGDIYNPKVVNALSNMMKKAKNKDICVGIFSVDTERAKECLKLGADYVVYNTDTMLFYEACR